MSEDRLLEMCACSHNAGRHAGPMPNDNWKRPCCGTGSNILASDCSCENFHQWVTMEEIHDSIAGLEKIVADLS